MKPQKLNLVAVKALERLALERLRLTQGIWRGMVDRVYPETEPRTGQTVLVRVPQRVRVAD